LRHFGSASDVLDWLANDDNPKQFHIIVPYKGKKEDSLDILQDVLKEKRRFSWWIDTKIAITIFTDSNDTDTEANLQKRFGAELLFVTASPKKVLQRIWKA